MSENEEQNVTSWKPKANQAKVLQTARELGFDLTKVAVAEKSGVSRSQIYRWLHNDHNFKEAWDATWLDLIDNHMPAVVAAQIKKARSGDTPAARLILEVKGSLKSRLEVTGAGGSSLFNPEVAKQNLKDKFKK